MNQILKDHKKIIGKWFRIYFIIVILCLIGLASWGGRDVYALFQEPKSYDDFKDTILQENENSEDLKHAYMELDVDKITGSYAAFAKSNDASALQQVYYLMPIENGTYFLTILANAKDIAKLDAMEQLFYENIGKETKTFAEATTYLGGFKLLSKEEQALAFDYFKGYDGTIQEQSQVSQYLCPYAFVIDEIGTISIPTLWTMFYVWVSLAIVTILLLLSYLCNVWQYKLKRACHRLPQSYQAKLEEDYGMAEIKPYGKIGKLCLYRKSSCNLTVVDLHELIWLYQKEQVIKEKRYFIVSAYTKDGNSSILWKGENQKDAKMLIDDIFTICPYILIGYQDFVYQLWQKNSDNFYEQLKQLDILPKPKKQRVRKPEIKG